jgi:glucokinase-like ROK family protein
VNDRDGEAALQLVYDLLDALTPAATSPLLGIGIGTPGLMNPEEGLVHKAVNLNWLDLPLRDLLVSRYDLPVYIANDSQVAALGEYTFGRNYPIGSMVVVKVGVGIGSGIIINQHLHYGDSYSAGEIGHIQVVADGLPCRCGNRGCLETVASTQTLLREARRMMRANPNSVLHRFAESPETLTTDAVLLAYHTGDEELGQVVASMGRYLGVALGNLAGILNIKQIVIGGSLARFGEGLLDPARQEMRRRVQSLLPEDTSVEVARLGTDIVIYGAAALLLTHELGLG